MNADCHASAVEIQNVEAPVVMLRLEVICY